MRLSIHNINKIEKADVKINGLTVIAGINDSGKSTIGKVLFSVIKALANSKDNSKSIDDSINRMVRSLKTNLRNLDRIYGTSLDEVFFHFPVSIAVKRIKAMDGEIFEKMDALNEEMAINNVKPLHKAAINRLISEIKKLSSEMNTPDGILRREIQAIFEAEFLNSICSYGTETSDICFSDESGNKELNIFLSNNVITKLTGGNKCFFDDITLIESPLYIHLMDVLASARTFNEDLSNTFLMRMRPQVNYHIKDFAKKMGEFKYSISNSGMYTEGSDNIDSITGGHFSFDQDNNNIFWEKDNKKYQVINVASGIKSFGIMQMLESVNAINEKKILIWDEPENHLHPEWQIKLAGLLVEKASKGIPILITSHSPYFIQAIRFFSDKMKMDKFVSYYMADENENGTCVMTDYTDDLNKIFYRLAEPMNSIINLGYME